MTDLNRGHTHHDHDHHHAGHDVRVRATVKDPVCGMMVAPDQTEHHARHGGAEFHFCSARCRDKFVADPERYLKPEAKPAAPEQAGHPPPKPGVIYTCPMHPEIRQEGPGNCPICGMALEPVTARRRGRAEPRTCGHDPAVLDRRRPDAAARHSGNGRPSSGARAPPPDLPASVAVASVPAGDAGGAVGGLAVLRAGLAVVREPQPEHVQPDRARRRRRLPVQPGRDVRCRESSRPAFRNARARLPSTSRRPP